MKKLIAFVAFTAAIASPALASDASDAMHAQVQPAYTTMWNGTGAYASTQNVTWQATDLRREAELAGINR